MADGSFHKYITECYGESVLNKFKSYAIANSKLANMQSRKSFLIKCRRRGMFPQHIVQSLKCLHEMIAKNETCLAKLDRCVKKFKKAILNIEIKQAFNKIKKLKGIMEQVGPTLSSITNENISRNFLQTQAMSFRTKMTKRTKTAHKKLSDILARTLTAPGALTTNDKAIFNATKVQVPAQTLTLLSLGPKFALTPTNVNQIPMFHVLADIEEIIRTHADKRTQDENRCRAINIIQNYVHGFHSQIDTRDPTVAFCNSSIRETKNFLRSHPDLCILSSDKGKRTVIMEKKMYGEKMLALVGDEGTYAKLTRDPTSGIQKTNNNLVNRLKNLKLIDYTTAKHLTVNNSVCPRIYGQPKAHKENLPLRPVIPNITAPTYRLSKFFANILAGSIKSTDSTHSSFEFCDEINKVILPEDHIILSLDVVSLFTNVPRELVTRMIIERWREVDTKINLDLFLEAISFCMESSYFQYKNQQFKQIYGTTMGSPLSPILADIALDSVIDRALTELPFTVPIIRKYVDDLFLAVPKDMVPKVLDVFNRQEPRLQFTVEVEKEGKLPFLDMIEEC
ncbi:uncharacterized protein LOC129728952 [Wyeomyia smithii]|uniref:uncharacterized protein LOC129728952 n=1 Tax=Wyeomyia smithii TaxID=174621 RepID=UPI002467D2B6|nr:uncharacterized protein LOC129728952 [Wyeomyia smithii]